ncbi:hypothetical protein N9933_03405 [bacterium]|nr:hypothetical protein [bacterium]
MLKSRKRLPFVIDNLYGGFAKVDGLMVLEGDNLWVEFQMKDNVLGGVVKAEPQEIPIPLEEIESVRYKKTWFVSKFFIRVYRIDILEGIPGNEKGEVKLKIPRRDAKAAIEMASRISYLVSELHFNDSEHSGGL